MFRTICAGLFAVAVALLAGCEKQIKPATEFKGKNQEHHHDEKTTQDVTLPDGKLVHAILTAHLDEKAGNELDVIIEQHEKDEPYPIPINAKLSARVTRKGDDKEKNLDFKPAEKDERKSDPDGKCSRFTAEAKWMKPDDELTVVLSIEYDGKLRKATYSPFVPKDSAHTHEHK
jgi:hypothetical protein